MSSVLCFHAERSAVLFPLLVLSVFKVGAICFPDRRPSPSKLASKKKSDVARRCHCWSYSTETNNKTVHYRTCKHPSTFYQKRARNFGYFWLHKAREKSSRLVGDTNMSEDYRDNVRDRTLVLRVLVPSLEARLREKMKDVEESCSRRNESKSILQDLDGVTCEPTRDGSTLWNFHCDGATYPARLTNLPCPVELHKTLDHCMYYKCVDVAQMLVVYEDEMALEEAEATPKSPGFPSYNPSGLTPPMKRVVERRFELREHDAVAPSKSEISEVEQDLHTLMDRIAKNKPKTASSRSKRNKHVTNIASAAVVEEVEEDIVDYEPWMTDNGKQQYGVEFDDQDVRATNHPEVWLSVEQIEEIKKAKADKEAEEAAKAAAAEAKKKKAQAKKEARKKKKEEGPSIKRGIPANKNREEVDEVTQAAAQMSQGLDIEDVLGGELDDLFNFNDDGDDLAGLY